MNPDPENDDTRLFREAVRDVKPLSPPGDRVTVGGTGTTPGATAGDIGTAGGNRGKRRPAPRARFTRADRHAVLHETLDRDIGDPEIASDAELSFSREGVQASILRKLKRGQFPVQAEIDLHGLTGAQAKEALREFLAHALENHLRCVRIIHGKGLRSGNRGSVLKGVASGVLQRVGPVVAYVSARQGDGGTGAVYALLNSWHAGTPQR